ncbi:MAG: hypothetical protein AAF660_08675 [Pseudomonadota bacterium]
MCSGCNKDAMRYAKPDVLCSEKLILGVSRFYLFHLATESPTLEQIEREVDGYGLGWILCPLMTFWDTVIESSSIKIDMKQPDCACRSLHEEALLKALRALSYADPWRAHESLLEILPASSVRLLVPELRNIVGRLACEARAELIDSRRMAAPMPPAEFPELRLVH